MNQNPEIKIEKKQDDPKCGVFSVLAGLLDYFEIFIFAILAVLFVFTFCFRTCRVDGNSMNNTLHHKELLIASGLLYEPEQGDIVVFHVSNEYYSEPLVKRVIATEGQKIEIDLTEKKVYVDGVLLEEPYVYLDSGYYNQQGYFDHNRLHTAENGHKVFSDVVPEGKIFVMGDNRNHSSDSRSVYVGLVDKNCVLGKALLRISPFTVFN